MAQKGTPGEVEYEYIYLMGRPRAAIKVDRLSGRAPLEVKVDGSLSTTGSESVRKIVRYEWDFGDGSPIRITTGPATSHQYSVAGSYVATVRVFTTQGASGTGQVDFVVR